MARFSLVVAALSIGLNAAISFHILWRFNRPSARDLNKLYEDRDGVATDESHRRYSTSNRIIKSVAIAVWAIGFLVSLATATSRTARAEPTLVTEAWLTFASWVSCLVLYLPRHR